MGTPPSIRSARLEKWAVPYGIISGGSMMIGYSTHYRTNCHRSPDTVRRDDAGSGDRRQVRRAARVRARWWGAGLQQAVAGGCTAGDAELLCARGVTGAVEATGAARRGRNPSGCSTGDRRSGFPRRSGSPSRNCRRPRRRCRHHHRSRRRSAHRRSVIAAGRGLAR